MAIVIAACTLERTFSGVPSALGDRGQRCIHRQDIFSLF